ncbi:hypothetical protein AAII07_36100 [Microvirga sp. 0TCS3.31]
MAVDQAGEEGAAEVGDRYVVRRTEGGGLDADDPVTLHQHRRAVREESLPVVRARCPHSPPRAHPPMVRPAGHRRTGAARWTRPGARLT